MAVGAPGGQVGVGTTLNYGVSGQSTTFATAIAQVVSISEPTLSAQPVETTLLADTVKSFIPGQYEYGEMTVSLRYAETDTVAVQALFGVQYAWKITKPDGSLIFDGYIKSLGGEVPEGGGVVNQTIVIKVTNDQAPASA